MRNNELGFPDHQNILKQAQQVLAYRIKKKREEAQKQAMQQQQQNGQIQMQSAQSAEQSKQQTLQCELQNTTKCLNSIHSEMKNNLRRQTTKRNNHNVIATRCFCL